MLFEDIFRFIIFFQKGRNTFSGHFSLKFQLKMFSHQKYLRTLIVYTDVRQAVQRTTVSIIVRASYVSPLLRASIKLELITRSICKSQRPTRVV